MGLFDIFRIGKIKAENEALKQELQDLHADEQQQIKEHSEQMNQEIIDSNLMLSKQYDNLPVLSEQSRKSEEGAVFSCGEPSSYQSDNITFPEWYVSLSFGKSSSSNYGKAVALAKAAPQYYEQTVNNMIIHQAIYSSKPSEYLNFIMLYELVGGWKSAFVIINGALIDRKIIGKLNYCYGDKCRSGNKKFCFGASYMTENPFGCHRLQISATNTPWWSFYKKQGLFWVLDKIAIKNRIDSYAAIYKICPCFDYDSILSALDKLPSTLSQHRMNRLADNNFGCKL